MTIAVHPNASSLAGWRISGWCSRKGERRCAALKPRIQVFNGLVAGGRMGAAGGETPATGSSAGGTGLEIAPRKDPRSSRKFDLPSPPQRERIKKSATTTSGGRLPGQDPHHCKSFCTASSTPSWRLWGIFFSSSRFLFCSLFSVIVLLLFSFFLLPLVFLYFSLLLFPARPLKRK